MRKLHLISISILLAAALLAGQSSGGDVRRPGREGGPSLQVYDTPYYVLHTDLDPLAAQEAALRMTRMAEEYHARTRGFSGKIDRRLPFYLFTREVDYYAAGGIPGSAGAYTGQALMAVAGEGADTWRLIQHEGFHQFAEAVIAGEMPIWINEGLAEYFGESIFTGDGFVTGVIPSWRQKRVQEAMRRGRFMPVQRMMLMPHPEWNEMLSAGNYDQAWSMVYFLAHGEDGRYQAAFDRFMNDIGRGRGWEEAWRAQFGSAVGFEEKWREYWLNLAENPTQELYVHAITSTLTSFLARAHARQQRFASLEQFVAAAAAGRLQHHPEDWLPPDLLREALEAQRAMEDVEWSLAMGPDRLPRIVAVLGDGRPVVGRFTLRGGRVQQVVAEVDELPQIIEQAQALAEEGNVHQARIMLRDGLRRHAHSPSSADARRVLAEMR